MGPMYEEVMAAQRIEALIEAADRWRLTHRAGSGRRSRSSGMRRLLAGVLR